MNYFTIISLSLFIIYFIISSINNPLSWACCFVKTKLSPETVKSSNVTKIHFSFAFLYA